MNTDLSNLLTAVVLTSKSDLQMDLKGLRSLVYINKFDPAHDMTAQLHHYRKRSVHLPTTPYMTWIDDDDELPDNVQDVCTRLIQKMESEGTYLGYTDEMVHSPTVRGEILKTRARKRPYSRQAYEENPYITMHHLVVMRVDIAQYADGLIPEGIYLTEFMFNLYLAELGVGATYLPEIGYIWNHSNRAGAMHLEAAGSPARKLCNRHIQEYLPPKRKAMPTRQKLIF